MLAVYGPYCTVSTRVEEFVIAVTPFVD